MEVKDKCYQFSSSTHIMMFSSAPHWLEYVQPEDLAVCQYVCSALCKAAQEDRIWKDACHRRWRRVNAVKGGYRRSFASLNGWREPRFRRTILTTTALARNGSYQSVSTGGPAPNISGMDVGPSTVVVCSANTAWFYRAPSLLPTSESATTTVTSTGAQRGLLRGGARGVTDDVAVMEAAHAETSKNRTSSGVLSGDSGEHWCPPWSCRVPGWNVTEARFSADEERCFFGTLSGRIYALDMSRDGEDRQDASMGVSELRRRQRQQQLQRRPTVSNSLTVPGGSPLPVRQLVENLEGGSLAGAKLGVLCRPQSGWQPNLDAVDTAGYLVLADTQAQTTARTMRLSEGVLGGDKFPSTARGGPAVSLAAVGSSGGSTVFSAGGETFAVGYRGGAVAVLDGRCQERGGMVGGFVTLHRWLERVRCAGHFLMASYGRCSAIETWDLRRLPTTAHSDVAVSTLSPSPPPPRATDLTCGGRSPDFWVAPHGLTVAVYGAPKNSQRYGARHSFWGWPGAKDRAMGSSPPVIPLQQQERMTEPLSEELMGGQDHRQQLAQAVDRLNFSRNGNSSGGRHTSGGGGRGSGRGGKAAWAGAARAGDVSELGYKVFSALQAFASAGVGVPRRSGVELAVPGVVTDSDYRLRLSTGIKFCDTHMVTVLDESRVLLDEVMVGGHDEAAGGSADGGSWCRRGGGMVHLNAEYI